MKSKKIYLIFGGIILIIILTALSQKKELKFSKYATVKYNSICEFESSINSEIYCTFEIINLSKNPFVIIDVTGDKNINFLNTKINKLIPKNDTTHINIKLIAKKIGLVEEKILIKSNAKEGDFFLTIRGEVRN